MRVHRAAALEPGRQRQAGGASSPRCLRPRQASRVLRLDALLARGRHVHRACSRVASGVPGAMEAATVLRSAKVLGGVLLAAIPLCIAA